MDFEIPREIRDYLAELDDFIERSLSSWAWSGAISRSMKASSSAR